MTISERIVPITLIAVAVGLYFFTGEMSTDPAPGRIDTATFPRVILGALIVLSVVQFFKSMSESAYFPTPGRVIAGVLLVVAYIVLIEIVGFFAVTLAYLVIFPLMLGFQNWKVVIGLATICTIMFYLVFSLLLGVPLPLGFFEDFGGF